MTDDHSADSRADSRTDTVDPGTAEKDPADWTTGDEPMTGPQRSYLETLLQQAGEDAPEDLDTLNKSEASRRIDELQAKTGRGQ